MNDSPTTKIVLYHNPNCSKSCDALKLLETHRLTIQVKLYLIDGISADDVLDLTKKLAMHPSEFVRKGEPEYKALETDEFSIEEWCAIIETHPILLERPIVIIENQAIIARPSTRILGLLKNVNNRKKDTLL